MTKTEVTKEMALFLNGARFITRKELALFLGYSDPHNVAYLLTDLKRVNSKYFIKDVAENIVRAGRYGD